MQETQLNKYCERLIVRFYEEPGAVSHVQCCVCSNSGKLEVGLFLRQGILETERRIPIVLLFTPRTADVA